MIGRVFNDRYRITERIGIGGMAEVYKAQDLVLRRTVAIKVMLPQYAADPDFSDRFKLEAAAAANLQNPYIVNIYDWGQDNDTYYIVMEYIRGTDLKSAIKQRGTINQRKVAEIGSQVCQALNTAHGQDIVHRDIKPQNIMVQPDGNVKVMDFGIARTKNSLKAQTSSVLGTAHYISPEQAQGMELDGTSDIYSLGCVLYEAATGVLPFDAPDAVSVALKQVQENPLPPSQVMPSIHPDFEAIIMKALEKAPANRFATARDMKQALDDFLLGRPVNLSGGYADYDYGQTAPLMAGAPLPAMSDAAGATAVMPVVGPGSTGPNPAVKSYLDQETTQDIHIPEKNTKRTVGIFAAILAVVLALGAGFIAFSGGLFSTNDGVPDLKGVTVEAAEQQLEEAGYKLGKVTEEYSSEVVSGRVMKQDPKAGTDAEPGTKVNVVVSKGTEKVEVPDLRGMSPEEAEAALEAAGFTGKQGNAEYSDMDEGRIFKQDPKPGSAADKGSVITYSISLGQETASVTSVINYSQEEAIRTLQNAGFNVAVESGGYSATVDSGYVIDQNPNGGKLEKGETVTIYISEGVDPETLPVEIPNVVGMEQSSAESALANAGFSSLVNQTYDGNAPAGTVISQSDFGSAKKGTTITITVSQGPQNSNSTDTEPDED